MASPPFETPAIATVSSTDAKNSFGELLERVQREPVAIRRHGRTSAYLLSADEFSAYQTYKLQRLREELAIGEAEAERGKFSSATPQEILERALAAHEQQTKL